MGLSSSQARLLSITARLTDNEYKSQRLTNAKMQLSNLAIEAQQNYSEALDARKLEYTNFNSDSMLTREDLTAAIIYDYQPYKNQYGLINNANQILVSRTDARNYEETNNLAEFLDRYGLLEEVTYDDIVMVHNPAYDDAWNEYNNEYTEWINSKPAEKILDPENPPWDEIVHTSELYEAALHTGCISGALGNTNCYMHVLSSWLGAGEHTTSSGETFTIYGGTHCGEHEEWWCWNTDQHPVDASLREGLKNIYPDNDHTYGEAEEVEINLGGSTYTVNTICACDPTKTVYQNIVDFLWEVHEDYAIGIATGGVADPTHLAQFFHILEFDLEEKSVIHHETWIDNPEYITWLTEEPEKPDVPEELPEIVTKTQIEVNDKTKGQWYTNLWFRMNGYDDPAIIETKERTDMLDKVIYYNILDFYGHEKNTFTKNYTIMDANLAVSKEWLHDSLKQGIITMERINSASAYQFKELKWQSIIYTNATDIIESDDEQKIAYAEAEYKAVMAEVNTKDKKFQMELRQLDSEHNAILTEYESVKAAMDKNIDRSFKAFQG